MTQTAANDLPVKTIAQILRHLWQYIPEVGWQANPAMYEVLYQYSRWNQLVRDGMTWDLDGHPWKLVWDDAFGELKWTAIRGKDEEVLVVKKRAEVCETCSYCNRFD